MPRVLAFLLLVGATASLPFGAALGRAQSAPPPASLTDVSWLSGHWVGKTASGQHIEEMWMSDRDGHMLGSFRWERGNGRWLFEFMTLTADAPSGAAAGAPGALTLRLKHFDRNLRGFEEKGESTTLTLTEGSSDRVSFQMKDGERTVRVGYTRSGADALTATFDETAPGKPAVHIEFPYKRVR